MSHPMTLAALPLQPVPVDFDVKSLGFPGGRVATSLSRVWAPGDTRVCRLCRFCTADHARGFCVVLVDRDVSDDDAPFFSTDKLVPVPSRP